MSKSDRKRPLATCGSKECSYELRARATRGRVYDHATGGPARKPLVKYEAAHVRARRDLTEKVCSLSGPTCRGRLEIALRPDAPQEHLVLDPTREIMFYSGPHSEEGYRYLCRSHHAREGSTAQVLARISDPYLRQLVAADLEGSK